MNKAPKATQPKRGPGSIADLVEASEADSRDKQIAELQKDVEKEREARLEERFIWFLVVLLASDAYVFSQMENWAGTIVIGAVELILIVVVAIRCGVNAVLPLIDRVTGAFSKSKSE